MCKYCKSKLLDEQCNICNDFLCSDLDCGIDNTCHNCCLEIGKS